MTTENMHFLRENRYILFLILALPVFLLWIDAPVIQWVRDFHHDKSALFEVYKKIVPVIKITSHGTTIATTAVILLITGKFLWRKCYVPGKSLLIAYLASGIVVQMLKRLFGRARPRVFQDFLFTGPTLHVDYDSFPSGHTAVMFCIAYTLSRLYPKLSIPLYGLAIAVGIGRVASHSHFPSDIIAGVITGIVIGKVLEIKFSFSDQQHRITTIKKQQI